MTRDLPQPTEGQAAITGRLRLLLLGGLILALGLVHGPSSAGGPVYDDLRLLEGNPRLAAPGGLLEWLGEPHWSSDEPDARGQLGHWRPLTVLAFAAGGPLATAFESLGLGPIFGHHLVSLLVHLLACLVLARLASRLLNSPAWGVATAFLFALHPVQVEAVGWVSAVNDPLYALFGLLTIERWIQWRREGSKGLPLAATLAWAAALLAKEQALVVPLVLVVHDLVVHLLADGSEEESELPLPRSYGPLVVVALAYLGARMLVFGSPLAGFDRLAADFQMELVRGLSYRVEVLGGLLGLLAWPAELAVFRGFQPVPPPGDRGLLLAAVWIGAYGALLALVWLRRSSTPSWVRALTTALPLLLLPQLIDFDRVGLYPISDRYLYLPVALFALLLAHALRSLLPGNSGLALAALIAVAWGVRSGAHAGTFEDQESFTLAAIEASPRVPGVRWQRGNHLLQRYQVEQDPDLLREAYLEFLESLALGTDYGAAQVELPEEAPLGERLDAMQRMVMDTPAEQRSPDPSVYVTAYDRLQGNLGQGFCYLYLAELDEAYDTSMAQIVFDQLATLAPRSELVALGQGLTYRSRGELEAAESSLRRAVSLNERNPDAWQALGKVLLEGRQYEAARNCFQTALELRPASVQILRDIAACAIEERRFDLAQLRLDEARELDPGDLEVLLLSGLLAALEQDYPDALAWFERALDIDDAYGRAHLEKAKVLVSLGQNGQAVRSLGRACELLPRSFEAHYNLASLLLAAGEQQGALPYAIAAYRLSEPGDTRDLLHTTLAALLADEPERFLELALIAQGNQDFEAALDWTERAIERSEPVARSARAHLLRGRYLEQLARPMDAAAALKQSLLFDEDSFWSLHDLGILLARRLGRLEEARPYLERALALLEDQGLEEQGLDEAIRKNLTATLEGREPEYGPLLQPIEAAGVEDR